jgi:maleate isomerase
VEEERATAAAGDRFGYPVETASRAAVWALRRMNAHRIAFVAAYPSGIVEAGCRYLKDAGIEVVRRQALTTRTADTRSIYELGSDTLASALQTLPRDGIDAVLVSGTGLPSLPALRGGGPPVVSSNLCLAARLLDLIGRADWLHPRMPFIRGWEQRLDEALSSAP